ncbi:MAG: phospholipase D-like domain-containing protein, partial [Thermoplasmata archaeon]
YLCRMLEDSGGKVYFSTQNASLDIHDRYDAIHSKVGIVDGRNVWVMSENLGMTGLPVNNTTGNRGWGVIVWNNTDLAQYFTDVFLEDTNTRFKDVTRYGTDPEYTAPSSGGPDQSIPTGYYEPKFPSRTVEVSSSRIEPVLGPDTTRMRTRSVLGMLDSATNSIYINFFYLYKHWGVPKNDYTPQTAPNHYLEAAIEAARRGVQVRILLDDTWYNVEAGDPVDNDDTVDYVNQIASSEGLDMEARLVDSSMLNLTKTHNKGMIVDHHLTLVGSVNGNYASTTNNREAALILDNPDVAMYFESVFFNDWDYSYVPGIPDPPSKVNAELYGSAHEHVNISWSLSLDDPSVGSGENDVANYAIYYSNNYDRGGIGYRFLTSLPPGTSYYLHPFAGDGDPNNYFYYVQANDTLGYVAKSPMQVAKFTRLLSSGTQLISIPLVLSNRTVQDALKTLHYDAVWSYSGKDRKWSYFMTFKPSNGFTEVDEKTGFWVHVLTPDYLTVAGRVPMSTKVNLYQSWNLLGYPSFLSRTAGEVFIPLSCDIVESYEESTPPYFLRKMASSDSVGPGNAYWIQCSSNTVWTVEN